MRGRRALLDPADVQGGRPEVHLIPTQVDQLGRSQAVPVGHEDHGRVAVAPAVALGNLDEPLDLGLGEVLAGAQLGVGGALGGNCSFYGGWRDQPEVGFGHVIGPSGLLNCSYNTPFTNSRKGPTEGMRARRP